MDIATIKSLCAKYDIHPSKKYGQNFLVDTRIAQMMMDAANLDAEDFVVEVGPGLGALTGALSRRVKKVLAVEIDSRMFNAAKEILAPYKNVQLVHGDILKVSNQHLVELFQNSSSFPSPVLSDILSRGERDTNSIPSPRGRGDTFNPPLLAGEGGGEGISPYKVVASLPYSITSAALRKFTEENPRPSVCVFLVQKEVAQRVCARPSPQPSHALTPTLSQGERGIETGRGGGGQMSVLSVAVQFYGVPEIVAVVKRGAFWPSPEVDSAVLKIDMSYGLRVKSYAENANNLITHTASTHNFDRRFFQIVRIGFSSRRKQLQNNLMAGLHLPREVVLKSLKSAGLSERIRAQELGVKEWIRLAELIGK